MPTFFERVLACTNCSLYATRNIPVVGSGPLDAALLLVGEAPGRSEDEGGEPFVGRSGQLLFRLIEEEIGLTRAECYVTNVVRCRPPNNRTPTKKEVAACAPWWHEQRPTLSPKVTLTLGLTSTHALLGSRAPMVDLHGVPVEVDGLTVVPTYHPAAALRGGPSVEAVLRRDLALVRQLLAA